tara:strand:+ start:1718 stop:2683 length:966 start_codon:yes stop_codon:yes gene_type:complete
MKLLITGCCGFIGFHLSKKLLNKNLSVIGIDNINNYYDTRLKKERLLILKKKKKFLFAKVDISNLNLLNKYIVKHKIKYIINLAAQAGVRYSILNPKPYFESNVLGFYNILETSRKNKIKHLIFASTSSVYGDNNKFPIQEDDNTDKPLSFYAATKKSNEVFAYSYSNIYKIPCTGLRFFTVYGPMGRPDMALFKFCKNILMNKRINVFNNGNHTRDFTYINDVVDGIVSIIKKPSKKKIPFQIFNISSNNPIKLKKFINMIEKLLGKKAKINNLKLQKGDVIKTHGSNKKIKNFASFKIKTRTFDGINSFIDWYKNFYKR